MTESEKIVLVHSRRSCALVLLNALPVLLFPFRPLEHHSREVREPGSLDQAARRDGSFPEGGEVLCRLSRNDRRSHRRNP